MRLSLSNGIFSKLGLEKNFAAVQQLGFENIEFNMKSVKKENDTDVYREQRLLKACGLKCLTLHSATLHVKDPVEVHRAVYYCKISLECAHALCAPLMTVHSNISKRLPRQVREECLAGIFWEIKPFAKSLGVKLARTLSSLRKFSASLMLRVRWGLRLIFAMRWKQKKLIICWKRMVGASAMFTWLTKPTNPSQRNPQH